MPQGVCPIRLMLLKKGPFQKILGAGSLKFNFFELWCFLFDGRRLLFFFGDRGVLWAFVFYGVYFLAFLGVSISF